MADIVLTARAHLRGRGVSDMGIVLPDHDSALGAVKGEEGLERVEHVLIPQVPGGDGAVVEAR